MNREEFIDVIKLVVLDDSIKSVESNLLELPGREPQKALLQISDWFNMLEPEDKIMVMKVVKESVETSVFGFLCVLDGVRAIENGTDKGKLNLCYIKGEEKVLLNNPEEEYLHDLL